MNTGFIKYLVVHSGFLFRILRASLDIFVTNDFQQKARNKGVVDIQWPLYMKGGKYVIVGDHFRTGPGFRCECIDYYYGSTYYPELNMGDYVSFGYHCHIGCVNKIIIGNYVLLGSNILITDHNHGHFSEEEKDIPWVQRELYTKGPVIIEDNVWVGDNVVILSGVTIGRGSVIGANSVVTKSIPAYSMAIGSPAKVIKGLSL